MDNATFLMREEMANDLGVGDPVPDRVAVRRMGYGSAEMSDHSLWQMMGVMALCMGGGFALGWVVGAWLAGVL